MAYVKTWDETSPSGSRAISLGDDDIREFKYAIRERLGTDHKVGNSLTGDETGITTIGYHQWCTFIEAADIGTGATGLPILGAQTVSGKPELMFTDEDNNDIQITDAGGLRPFKQGDWILSTVATARTGWTNVSSTYSNKFMRINATPLTTGGADTHTHAAGSFVGPSQTHTIPWTGHSGAAGSATGTVLVNPGGTSGYTNDMTDNLATGASGTGAVTGTSASGDNVPAYVQVVVFQKD